MFLAPDIIRLQLYLQMKCTYYTAYPNLTRKEWAKGLCYIHSIFEWVYEVKSVQKLVGIGLVF